MSTEVLSAFVSSQYVPSRMVLAAAGYNHDALVSLAESHFGSLPAGMPQAAPPVDYVGGEIRESSPDGDEMTHFALSFKVRSQRLGQGILHIQS
jgi:predicted Zn-dependent peptidase